MKVGLPCLAAVLLLSVAGRIAQADWQVWTVTETRHVVRSEPPGRELAVNLAAVCNEWVSFQILLRAAEPVPGVRVEAGDLRGPEGAVLHASERRLYRQHQLHLEVGTHRNDAFRPDWYPDPLIPCRVGLAPPTLSGGTSPTLQAMPFDLPANETHGFWVDLYVPAETAPGEYRGAYRVTAEGEKSVDVPVTLTVWDFTLPPTPSLVTAFGSPAQRLRDYYRQRAKEGKGEPQPSDWQAVETQCAQLLRDHRFNATPPVETLRPIAQSDGTFQIPSEQVQALRRFVDRYHVNAVQVPHPSSVVKDPETQRDTLHAWLAAFDRAAKDLDRPHIVFYVYLKDEPNTREDYEYVQKWGRAIREAKSVIQVMVVEQTWTAPGQGGADSAWGDLYGAVDIWCPLFSLHRQDSAARRQARGETVWTYTALCQGPPTPWWHIDYPLLNYRVPAWMAWRDRMKGLLYWGGMSHWRETDDPWLHAPVYTGRGVFQQGDKGIRFNGEGSLVYPARAVGYDGIAPTIRLKALRDAIEDYEYLAILDRLGESQPADQIVRRLTESWFQWEEDPAAYEKARAELAALIVAGSAPAAARAEIRFQQVVLDKSYVAYERDVGDIDGDGRNDVAAVMEGDTTVQVFHAPTWKRSTLVTFTGEHRYPRADDFKLADMDGDGDLDVVTRLGKGPADDGPGLAVWCENLGSGSQFIPHLIGKSLEYVKDIVMADFDRDGRPDVAMRMDGRTQLWFQEADGTWTEVRLTHPAHEGMEAGDLDGDGDPDLILNGYWFETPDTPAAARLAANYAYHVIDAAWFSQTGDWTKNSCKVVVGDFDGDGRNDVAFSHSERAGHAVAWYGSATPRGEGVWSKHAVAVVDFCHTLQAADFDLDGDVDLLVGGMIQSQHRGLKLLLNSGKGTNWTRSVIQTDGSYSAELGDIDNDGDPDIVGIRNWNAAPTWIYRNDSAPRGAARPQAISSRPCPRGVVQATLGDGPEGDGTILLENRAMRVRYTAKRFRDGNKDHIITDFLVKKTGGPDELMAVGKALVDAGDGSTADISRTNAAPYLAAVRQFADLALAHGRDTYGQPTPLFVDGLNVDTREPVKWKWGDGKEWVLCNLSSQQGLFRTLDGLSRLTGEPRYKDAALAALRYAFDHLRYGTQNNGGLLAWGGHLAYNATDDVIAGHPEGTGRTHELKCFFPHYELMWEADPQATRQLIENMWNGHVLDWARLDFNRHASPKKMGLLWQNEYRGGEVFFDGQGLTFHNAGSDFYFAAGMLSKLAAVPEPLVWAQRLCHRFVETRDPKTGLGGFQFSQSQSAWCDDVGKVRGDRAQYQYGADFPGHRVVEGTLFPCYGDTPEVSPQVGRLLLGEQLGEAGRDFTRWAVEELTAWGRSAYRKKDNTFIPMLTDGTSMEGYVCKKDGYFGPKGRVLRAGHPGAAHLWLYAWAFRLSRDAFLWEMARNIAQGSGWGDIGAAPQAGPVLRFSNSQADPFLIFALLELHRAGGNTAFLDQAQAIAQNLLKQRVQEGWFVPSPRHLFCRLSNNEAQALLHLAAVLLRKPESVPAFTGASPFFHAAYGEQTARSYDSSILYGKIRP